MGLNYGKALRIDLSAKKIANEKIWEDIINKFIGRKGFAAKVLYDELKPGADP